MTDLNLSAPNDEMYEKMALTWVIIESFLPSLYLAYVIYGKVSSHICFNSFYALRQKIPNAFCLSEAQVIARLLLTEN